MRIRTLAALGTTAAALTIALAAPAVADPSADPGTDTKDRGAKVCGRLPQVEARADKVLARLQGGETTKGSVAFARSGPSAPAPTATPTSPPRWTAAPRPAQT